MSNFLKFMLPVFALSFSSCSTGHVILNCDGKDNKYSVLLYKDDLDSYAFINKNGNLAIKYYINPLLKSSIFILEKNYSASDNSIIGSRATVCGTIQIVDENALHGGKILIINKIEFLENVEMKKYIDQHYRGL